MSLADEQGGSRVPGDDVIGKADDVIADGGSADGGGDGSGGSSGGDDAASSRGGTGSHCNQQQEGQPPQPPQPPFLGFGVGMHSSVRYGETVEEHEQLQREAQEAMRRRAQQQQQSKERRQSNDERLLLLFGFKYSHTGICTKITRAWPNNYVPFKSYPRGN